MTRKSGTKWGTEDCGRCKRSHSGFSGKLDINNIEYVICGNKRMNVSGWGKEGNSFVYPTDWFKENK